MPTRSASRQASAAGPQRLACQQQTLLEKRAAGSEAREGRRKEP
jgi:hypothetical protein